MIENFLELEKSIEKTTLLNVILKEQTEETGLTADEIYSKVETVLCTMKNSIQNGLKSSELSKSALSGDNCAKLLNDFSIPLFSPFIKKAILYSLAVIEENARMGKIAACPTAGSSGIVPGVLVAAMEEFQKTDKEIIDALIVSGEFGRIISCKMPLAGAVAGCQAECGAAAAMAASALCYLLGAKISVLYSAAALSLKNVMGLTCDPVAGLVEIPCVKRNAFLTVHAITSSYLALSGIKSAIPLDDVVDAMKETGMLISPKLKESAEAGLALTKTGLKIKDGLHKMWQEK